MVEQKNEEQDSKVVVAVGSKQKEPKSNCEKNAKIILEFLQNCTPYEGDAIRVMVNATKEETSMESMKKEDMLAVNRYLNYGLVKEDGDTISKVLVHRQKRAQTLMKSVAAFVSKNEIVQVSCLLMMISADNATLNTTCKNLPSRSEDSRNANGQQQGYTAANPTGGAK